MATQIHTRSARRAKSNHAADCRCCHLANWTEWSKSQTTSLGRCAEILPWRYPPPRI